MKRIITTLFLLFILCGSQAWAQTTTSPVFNFPIAPGYSAYVDMDVNDHSPLINQIRFAAPATGGNLMIAAAAGGTAFPFPQLDLAQPCNDSDDALPPCFSVGLIIDHGNGFHTIYAGIDSSSLANSGISAGDYVYAGQPLAFAGHDSITGTIHFEFEAWTCNSTPPCGGPIRYPDSLTILSPTVNRDLESITDRAGKTFLRDKNDIIPMFGFATGIRTLYTGEWVSVPGAATVTTVFKMGGLQNEASLNLYPNPSQGRVMVSLDLLQASQLSLQILDLQGAVVAQPVLAQPMQEGHNEIQLDLGQLATGLYLYRATAGNQTFSGKLQIVH